MTTRASPFRVHPQIRARNAMRCMPFYRDAPDRRHRAHLSASLSSDREAPSLIRSAPAARRRRAAALSRRTSPSPPTRPRPGALVRLTLTDRAAARDSFVAVVGHDGGRAAALRRRARRMARDRRRTRRLQRRSRRACDRLARVRPRRHAERVRHAAATSAAEGAARGRRAIRSSARLGHRGARGARE